MDTNTYPDLNKPAAASLLKRIIPGYADSFIIEQVNAGDTDVFEVESRDGKIVLRGNNGVSIASALHYYLRHYARCDISRHGSNLAISGPLPAVPVKIRMETLYRRRFFLNYCAFSYSMCWWNWERWEKEIDWMALHGINMPLALTGQNIVWSRVYRKLGFTDREMADFFCGPGYLSWFWMGNLNGWGGPLPESWMTAQEALQRRILARQRELGMTPVLPAFTGRVPPAFKERYPDVKLKTTQWVNFPEVHVLDPEEPMFLSIGKMFMEELISSYGTDHLYSADTFNENIPPTTDPGYLKRIGRKICDAMVAADPDAIWVMQAWMFVQDYLYWTQTQVKALLEGIPDDRMIILDSFCETYPAWKKTKAFYGKPWIWNMLQNFGGCLGMFGRMDEVANAPVAVWNDPGSGNMTGIGVMPEGLEQNPVMYALMLDHTWRKEPPRLEEWLTDYARRRYGRSNADAEAAWMILRRTVYNGGMTYGTPKTIICARPTFKESARVVDPHKVYADKDFLPAWEKFVRASRALRTDGFLYDLADVTRQALTNYADALQRRFAVDFRQNDLQAFEYHTSRFLGIIDDLDKLLGTRQDFLLGAWLNAAKRCGTNPEESRLFEKNARNLITTWGNTECWLNDYASRQWNGMMSGFYKPRWEQFISRATFALEAGQHLDIYSFESAIREWEWNWVHGCESYPDEPEGDPVEMATALFEKYGREMAVFRAG